jgi:hypothetical protein
MAEFDNNLLKMEIESASKELNNKFISDIVNIIRKYDTSNPVEITDTSVVDDDVIKTINEYLPKLKINEPNIDINPLFNDLDTAMVNLYNNAVVKSLEISKKIPSSEGGSKSGQKGGSLSRRGQIAMILFLGAGIGGCLFAIADLSKKISNMSNVHDQTQGTNIMVICVPIICVIFLSCMIWGLLNQMCQRGAESVTIHTSGDVESPEFHSDMERAISIMRQLRYMYQNPDLYGGIQEIINNIERVKDELLNSIDTPVVWDNLRSDIDSVITKLNKLLTAEESPTGESPTGESPTGVPTGVPTGESQSDSESSTDSNATTLSRQALPDNNNNPQHVFPCFNDITERNTFFRLMKLSPKATQLLQKRVEELDDLQPGGMRMNRRKRNMKTRMRSRKTQKGQPARNRRTQKPQPVRRRRTHRRKHRRTRK